MSCPTSSKAVLRAAPWKVGAAALVAAALAACGSAPLPSYDLTAPSQRVSGGGLVGGQLVVVEPSALQPLEDQRILVRDAAGSVSFLGGAQWADRLPRLLQTRIIQTFENATRIRAVSRPGEGVTADYQLNSDLRAFQLDAARSEAFVEISAKLIRVGTGKIAAARVFGARVPVATANGPEVAQALDQAAGRVLLDVVRWVGTGH